MTLMDARKVVRVIKDVAPYEAPDLYDGLRIQFPEFLWPKWWGRKPWHEDVEVRP